MITEIDSKLLEKIADLTGQPVGAFNIRKDSGFDIVDRISVAIWAEGEVADEIQASLADFSDYIGGQTLARSVKFCECAKDAAEVEWNDGTIRIKVSKLDA